MNENTVKELMEKVKNFCEERDWDQFHNPKDLAIGISTEANELLDIFRFKSEKEMSQFFTDQSKREHIEEELADTLFFILRFAQMNHIDLGVILENKIHKNGEKYPVEKIRGKNLKYDEI
ncbi:nucleotide pyrophosphohydrolase [Robinsoniella peoriensis]|uniref:nucleotide pyrophosphohydrolase n=1 Tax=Robinsoniella peoriensis TaxID=180332 RepID=UPI0005C7D69F|nr:nucleotide pyrophosphohydrolase [Robinsoniella peoriensis]